MSSEQFQNPAPKEKTTELSDWQEILTGLGSQKAATAPVVSQPEAEEALLTDSEGEACAICYRPFAAEELTVASKERFNWEAAAVVCPECLTELKLEMRARSSGPDLLLGLIWAVIGALVTSILISLAIWSVRSDTSYNFWQWIGCYFAFVPGFIIGRLVRFGVGKRHSLEQQLIAMFFTFVVVVVTAYVGWIADNNNFADAIMRTDEHRVAWLPFDLFVTARFWPALTGFNTLENIIPRLGIDFGIIVGLAVAFFSSEGSRIYTRTYRHS
ncbi:MAG TPA: hypothetical protein VH186_19720 [Chloroflexia bacterium]|nr:hypothetical protein [Chloroflexia bacterium]